MRQILLVVDVQSCFAPPLWLIEGINRLSRHLPCVALIEQHDESQTPFLSQLGWCPPRDDCCLIDADAIFIKHGYTPSPAAMEYLRQYQADRILVCGIQTDTCVLAAGFALFDAGLHPTLITDLTVGSSLDRSGAMGIKLWKHHFGRTIHSRELRLEQDPP
ncbi:cysteine hydrolase family protein [Alcaligenes sp. Lyrl_28]|uniref:cysteine hydrolase family protein n=1 Tax=Alcaligenes sp. Lyrl_28 TaxID=3110924 RepID=UPI003F7B591B